MRIKTFTGMLVMAGLAGCAAPPTLRQMAHDQHRVMARVQPVRAGLIESGGAYVGRRLVRYDAIRHPVTIRAHHTPIGILVAAAAHAHGDSVFFVHGAKASTPITASVHGASFPVAMRTLAEAAGYAAVWRPHRHEVLIAPRATYFYRLPVNLLTAGSGQYAVGGNTAASGSQSGGMSGGMAGGMGGGSPMAGGMGAAGGTGGASGSSGSSMEAEFTISGATQAEKVKSLRQGLQALAGTGGRVGINAATGIVAVTAGGRGLARVGAFIRRYVRAADTRVQIHTAILEVSLTHGLQWGINWSKIANITGAVAKLGFANSAPALANASASATGGGTAGGATTLSYTGASVNSLVSALRTVTDVRVVSEPSLVVENGTPSTLFSGTQLPYVGSVSSNVTGLSGSASTGAGLSYALNGLSLSVLPDVLSNRYVTLTVVPALSEINRFETFTVNGTQLQGPVQNLRQTYIQSLVPSGKTLIIGGSRQMSSTHQDSATPGLGGIPFFGKLFQGIANQGKVEQLVILVHATILPAPHYDPLVGSSL